MVCLLGYVTSKQMLSKGTALQVMLREYSANREIIGGLDQDTSTLAVQSDLFNLKSKDIMGRSLARRYLYFPVNVLITKA